MINKILKRTSCRYYSDKKISCKKIDLLKRVINSAPTSINAQAFSAIFITDQSIKKQMSEINWNQKHLLSCPLLIVFVADLNRLDKIYKNHEIGWDKADRLESFTTAVVDATIAATFCVNAALDLKLSTCYIGGVRGNIEKVSELLNIKGKAVPMLALTVGYERKKVAIRPKINKVYDNKYDFNLIDREIVDYNKVMNNYFLIYFKQDIDFEKSIVNAMGKFDYKDQMKSISKKLELSFKK